MPIKLSGMISGMDTDTMIDELVSAYAVRKDSYVKDQKALEYKQDAWKAMNTKIYSLFSGKLSNLRFSTSYAIKSVKASNTDKVTVSGSSKAVNGTQELKVTSLAKSGYLTGGVVSLGSGKDKVKGSTTLSELGVSAGRINVTAEGKESYIDVTADMTVDKFVSALKGKGLNASFDETNQRFFISAKSSGRANDFSINGNDEAGTDVLKSLGLYSVSTKDIGAFKDYISAADADPEYMTGLAKNEYLNSLINGEIGKLNTELGGYNDTLKSLNEKLVEANDKKSFAALSDKDKDAKIKDLNDQISALQKKIDEENAKATDDDDTTEPDAAAIDGYNEAISKLSEKSALYSDIKNAVGSSETEDFKTKLEEYNKTINENIDTINVDIKTEEDKIKGVQEKIKDAQGQFSATIEDKEKYLADKTAVDYNSAEYADYSKKYADKLAYAKEMVSAYEEYENLMKSDAPDETRLAELRDKLGLAQNETGAVRIAGEDAEIYLNGAKFTSNTNNFQINGLTITTNALTEGDETISLTTSTDVDGIYNMVKDFFKEYNTLMREMEVAYNAPSAGSYEPLTDEEMEDLTDKQIEKWETKVKDAVLRKDSTLAGISGLLKSNMSMSFDINGEKLSLASFGIKTLGYFDSAENERGVYHIDGDPDDAKTSGNADKLKSAIASDPDKFISFFSKLTDNVYQQLNKKMSSSSLSSAYTVYNDKYMKKQYDSYSSKISDWEDRLDAIREKYERQFASMETALSQLQSQSSYFSSMLGY